MKILFVLEHYVPYIGGAEELFSGLTRALVQRGHHVMVITTRHKRDLPTHETINGVHVHRVRSRNRFFFTFMSMREVIRQATWADIIHTTSYNGALPAQLASFLKGKKCIITFHEVWDKLWFRLPFISLPERIGYYLFEQMILRLNFHRYVAVSGFTRERLLTSGVPERKVTMIYNGINYKRISEFSWNPPATFILTYFGRLGISKGLEILLPAFAETLRNYPEIQLKLIIPTYPRSLFKRIMRLIDELKIRNSINLMHDLPVGELLREVASSSCVVIPSHSEGFCFTAVEAMAMHVPLIHSGLGALPEVVGGRYICLGKLSVQSLAVALTEAIRNQWSEIAEKRFPAEDTLNNYLELYKTSF